MIFETYDSKMKLPNIQICVSVCQISGLARDICTETTYCVYILLLSALHCTEKMLLKYGIFRFKEFQKICDSICPSAWFLGVSLLTVSISVCINYTPLTIHSCHILPNVLHFYLPSMLIGHIVNTIYIILME